MNKRLNSAPRSKASVLICALKKTDLIKNRGRYLLLLPSLVFMILFAYIPMVGIVVAFQRFDPYKGFFGSPWAGVDNFKAFFTGDEWLQVTLNTVYLNALFIISGTALSIFIAIVMAELKNRAFSKTAQTFMTLPNFVSWATIALFSVAFLNYEGIVNRIITAMGGKPVAFYSDPDVWVGVFVVIRAWKGAGWGAIIYMAAILGIDKEIYEAAKIDGASRPRCILTITLPLIKNTVVLMLIMSIGGIFRGDFGMIYPFVGANEMLRKTTDVIDTFVFRSMFNTSDVGIVTAVGLYQSVMGFVLVIAANKLAKRYAPESAVF